MPKYNKIKLEYKYDNNKLKNLRTIPKGWQRLIKMIKGQIQKDERKGGLLLRQMKAAHLSSNVTSHGKRYLLTLKNKNDRLKTKQKIV